MRPLPSLKQLRYLVTLSEKLNFTRAAEACFVTQSTLSAGLKELEETLSAQLVERDRQNVRMTPLGDEIVERARGLLAAAEDLAEVAAGAAEPLSGPLRLGAIPTVAPFVLPQLLPRLRQRYPRLQPLLREDLTAHLLARLKEGTLDFALIALPFRTEGLLERQLFDDELWLAGPQDDPDLQSREVRVSDALMERLLLLEEGHCLREHTLAACQQAARPGGFEATSLLTLLQMVEAGMGLALVPEMAVQSGVLNHTGLLARPLAPPVPKRSIALVARQSTSRRRDFDLLADFILEERQHRQVPVLTSRGRRAGRRP